METQQAMQQLEDVYAALTQEIVATHNRQEAQAAEDMLRWLQKLTVSLAEFHRELVQRYPDIARGVGILDEGE
jgi:hypothetical protein